MSDTDIVTWLRSILHNDRSVELRCQEAADEIERLRKKNDLLKEKLVSAHCLLFDYDGHYNPTSKTGKVENLASLIDEAVSVLRLD